MRRNMKVFNRKYYCSLLTLSRILYTLVFLTLLIFLFIVYNIDNFQQRSERTVRHRFAVSLHGWKANHGPTVLFKNELKSEEWEKSSFAGYLNVHTWPLTCNFSLERLLEYPLFPSAPQLQTFTDTLDIRGNNLNGAKSFARHVFGFLRAPFTGNYKFSLSTNGSAEVWLSKDKHWGNVQLICNRSGGLNHQISPNVFLENNKYYFLKILHIQASQNHSVHLAWQQPHSIRVEEINKTYIFSFTKEYLEFKNLIKSIPLMTLHRKYSNKSILENTAIFSSGAKYLDFNAVKLALPLCPYKPGYVGKEVQFQYHAVEKFVNPSYVYPEVKHSNIKEGKWNPWFPLVEKDAVAITEEYMKNLQLFYPGRYKLKKILNVERKPDWPKENTAFYEGTKKYGDRYFLELQLWDQNEKKDIILSEYIYQYSNNSKLCYPEGVLWNKTVPIYILITVWKQTEWAWHFIKNMEWLYSKTNDENLHVVVYDYDSKDIDIEAEFKKSSFKKYKILKSSGIKFSKTYALNRAAEAVIDQNAIIFIMDLHLEIPTSFANNVRKHCIKGKMVYTPILCRLACGASSRHPSGAWDPWGYGMFGVYKSDWDRFQGFDEEKYKTRWGGEDWDIVDRAYKVGLEFERIKLADFYHYDHTRKGMWNNI